MLFRSSGIDFSPAQQAVDHCRSLVAGIGPCKEIILAAERDNTKCPFGPVVVDLEKTVIDVWHFMLPNSRKAQT